ncbi:hypothetical protein ACV1DR_17315 [Aeromonas jandaei]
MTKSVQLCLLILHAIFPLAMLIIFPELGFLTLIVLGMTSVCSAGIMQAVLKLPFITDGVGAFVLIVIATLPLTIWLFSPTVSFIFLIKVAFCAVIAAGVFLSIPSDHN